MRKTLSFYNLLLSAVLYYGVQVKKISGLAMYGNLELNEQERVKENNKAAEDRIKAAIQGIENYNKRKKSHLSALSAYFDADRGVRRARFYYNELSKTRATYFYKDVMLYCLLTSQDGTTLQADVCLANVQLNKLKESLHARCLKAAGGNLTKTESYWSKLTKLTNAVTEEVNQRGKIPNRLTAKLNQFERMLGADNSDQLIPNIIEKLSELNVAAGGHVHDSLAKLKYLAMPISNHNGKRSNLAWSAILTVCKERTSTFRSALSHFSFCGLKHTRDPGVDLMLRALAQFDKNRAFAPQMNNLEQLLIAQQKRDAIEKFEQEIEQLYHNLAINVKTIKGVFKNLDSSPSGQKIIAYRGLIQRLSGDINQTASNTLNGDLPAGLILPEEKHRKLILSIRDKWPEPKTILGELTSKNECAVNKC